MSQPAETHSTHATRFTHFADFYPFYLGEHSQLACRKLHYVGTSLHLLILAAALFTGHYAWIIASVVCGYAFAWVGHYFIEHNRPATFKYPFFSLRGDYVMLFQAVTGRLDHAHFKSPGKDLKATSA